MDAQPPAFTPPQPAPPASENWRLYLELSSLLFFVFPFGNIFGPLVLWLMKKDSSPFVDREGRKVINFNLSWTIWTFVTCGAGFFVWLVIAIIGIIKAANNEDFKHPLTISFMNS